MTELQETVRLSAAEVEGLDPYALMAVLGKRLIHPGGRRSSEELFARADIQPGERVLDIGCGVATTAVEAARRFGAQVTAADISPLMLQRARRNVRAAGLDGAVAVQDADIVALPYDDDAFDVVIAEAVTMFVDRARAARELVRVTRPGGRVLATEFLWRRPPTDEARQIFLGEVCPGMQFDSLDEWVQIYRGAGLADVEVVTGPFEMMTPRGFVADEGITGSLAIMLRACSRWAYAKRLAWLMPRINRAVPYLGYVLVSGRKP